MGGDPEANPGLGAEPASGQNLASEESNDSPLGIRQQRIKRMVVELERQFTELARALQKDYPDQSEKARGSLQGLQGDVTGKADGRDYRPSQLVQA